MICWLYLTLQLNYLNLKEKVSILQLFSMDNDLSFLCEALSS